MTLIGSSRSDISTSFAPNHTSFFIMIHLLCYYIGVDCNTVSIKKRSRDSELGCHGYINFFKQSKKLTKCREKEQ